MNAIDTLHFVVTSSTSTTGTSTLVAGWQPGDVAYGIIIHRASSSVTVTPPAGWTEVAAFQPDATNLGVFVFRRVLEPGDTNPTWTVTGEASGWSHQLVIVRGANQTTPEAAAATATDNAAGTSHSGAALSVAGDGALVASIATVRASTLVQLSSPEGFHIRTGPNQRLQTSGGSAQVAWGCHEEAGDTRVPVWSSGASVASRIVQFAVASASYVAGDPFIVGWTPMLASGAATQAPGLPAGWQENDVAVAVGLHRNTSATLVVSAGWDLGASDITGGRIKLYAWKRRLQVGDSGPTITPSTTSNGYGSYVLALRNVSIDEDIAASVELNNTWTTLTPSSISTVTAGATVVFVTGTGDDNTQFFEAPQGFAGLIATEFNTSVGSDWSMATGIKKIETPGPVTFPTIRQNWSPGDNSTTLKMVFGPPKFVVGSSLALVWDLESGLATVGDECAVVWSLGAPVGGQGALLWGVEVMEFPFFWGGTFGTALSMSGDTAAIEPVVPAIVGSIVAEDPEYNQRIHLRRVRTYVQ